jgi:hypothetical protein
MPTRELLIRDPSRAAAGALPWHLSSRPNLRWTARRRIVGCAHDRLADFVRTRAEQPVHSRSCSSLAPESGALPESAGQKSVFHGTDTHRRSEQPLKSVRSPCSMPFAISSRHAESPPPWRVLQSREEHRPRQLRHPRCRTVAVCSDLRHSRRTWEEGVVTHDIQSP